MHISNCHIFFRSFGDIIQKMLSLKLENSGYRKTVQGRFTCRWGTTHCVYWYQSWTCLCGCWWERYRAYLSAHAADHYKATEATYGRTLPNVSFYIQLTQFFSQLFKYSLIPSNKVFRESAVSCYTSSKFLYNYF